MQKFIDDKIKNITNGRCRNETFVGQNACNEKKNVACVLLSPQN